MNAIHAVVIAGQDAGPAPRRAAGRSRACPAVLDVRADPAPITIMAG